MFKPATSAAVLLALASIASCTVYGPTTSNSGPTHSNPNATVSATFGDSDRLSLRINVTEAAVENATTYSGDSIPDAHIINTSYDLSWPDSRSLNQALGSQNASTQSTLCALIVQADFAQSVFDAYDPDSPFSCSVPLGDSCATAITQSVLDSEKDAYGCPTSVELGSLTECEGRQATGAMTAVAYPISTAGGNDTVTEASTFFNAVSEAYTGSNATMLADAASRQLQVVFLTTIDGTLGTGMTSVTEAACMVVEPQEAEVENGGSDSGSEESDGGESTSSGDGGSADENAAMRPSVASAVGFGMMFVAAILLF